MSRFLFVGLGNPTDQFTSTRHNAGWLVLDWLLEKWADPSIPLTWKNEKKLQGEIARLHFSNHEIFALKPQTFMNDSGESVRAALQWYFDEKFEDGSQTPEQKQLVIFHDDLDLETGKYKLQFGTGPKIHNGVNSVRQQIGTTQFWHARIGIDSRQGDRSIPGTAYVLQKFNSEEMAKLKEATQLLAEELLYTVLK